MDVSLLKLKAIFRQAAGRKGTLLARALRRRDARDAKGARATIPPLRKRQSRPVSRCEFGSTRHKRGEASGKHGICSTCRRCARGGEGESE